MSSIFSILARFWWILALGIIGAIALWFIFIVLPPERQIISRQFVLYQSVEKNKWNKLEKMIHPSYKDAWSFDRDLAILALKDARAQFITLNIDAPEPTIEVEGSEAKVTVMITVRGFGGTGSQMLTTRSEGLKVPFVFEWEQTGKGRKGWLLRRVSNEELDFPSNYEPGVMKEGLPSL